MAFSLNLANQKIFAQGFNSLGFGFWRYGNPNSAVSDTLATILGANYFSAAGYLVSVGDIISVRDSAGVEALLQVTANSNLPVLVTGNPAPTPTGTVTVKQLSGTAIAGDLAGTLLRPRGALFQLPAAVVSSQTAEQVLGTFSLPANALDAVGRAIHIRAVFKAKATANNKTWIVYFGASTFSSGALATNAKNGVLEMRVVKTAANVQTVTANGYVDTTNITPGVSVAGADTDTAAIVIKATSTNVTDVDGSTLADFSVEYIN